MQDSLLPAQGTISQTVSFSHVKVDRFGRCGSGTVRGSMATCPFLHPICPSQHCLFSASGSNGYKPKNRYLGWTLSVRKTKPYSNISVLKSDQHNPFGWPCHMIIPHQKHITCLCLDRWKIWCWHPCLPTFMWGFSKSLC